MRESRHRHKHLLQMQVHRWAEVELFFQDKGRTDVEMLDIKQAETDLELLAGREVQVVVEEGGSFMSAITGMCLTLDALHGLRISLAVLRWMARDKSRAMETTSQVAATG